MRISIILKTWNALEYTKLCIFSLREYTRDDDYELIVVDNGSTDGTKEFLGTLTDIKFINNDTNKGWMGGNIQGMEIADCRYVCLIDNDVYFSEKWLPTLMEPFQFESVKPLGMVAPLQPHPQFIHPYIARTSSKDFWLEITSLSPKQHPIRLLEDFCLGKNYNTFVGDFLVANQNKGQFLICPPDYVGGSCILMDRIALDNIGALDDKIYGLYGADDVDLCWRFGDAGYKIYRTSKSYVHHFKHASLNASKANKAELNRKTSDILFSKWESRLIEFIKNQTNGDVAELCNKYVTIEWFVNWLKEKKSCPWG